MRLLFGETAFTTSKMIEVLGVGVRRQDLALLIDYVDDDGRGVPFCKVITFRQIAEHMVFVLVSLFVCYLIFTS